MGTLTTNFGFYKPVFDEEGYDDEVNASFDDIDRRLHPLNPSLFFAAPDGDNANDGLSWATAKKDILGAYDAISYGGEIHFADGTFVDAANPSRGLWLVGVDDAAGFAAPPAGWRRAKPLTLVGVAGANWTTNAHAPGAWMRSGDAFDRNQPSIWLSGHHSPIEFRNIHIQYPAVAIRIGINTTQTAFTNTSGLTFDNITADLNQVFGNGPTVEYGYSFWTYWRDCSLAANAASVASSAASITAGTTAKFTIGTHAFVVGDTFFTTGYTAAGYNGTWTVIAKDATSISADIGTSPAAATVQGTVLPVRHYRRAIIAHDGVDRYPGGLSSGLMRLDNCIFNGGGVHYAPSGITSWGRIVLNGLTVEGDFGAASQPPALHLRAAYGATKMPESGTGIWVNGIELADGTWPDGAVKIDGEATDPGLTTIMGASSTGNALVLDSRYNESTRHGKVGVIAEEVLGRHIGHRRQSPLAAVRFANRALTDPATWTSGIDGVATVTTGKADPHGGTLAGRLSTGGSNDARAVYRNAIGTPGVGDWVIAGVWQRLNSGSGGSPSSDAIVSLTNTNMVLSNSGSSFFTLTKGLWLDNGWCFVFDGGKITSVGAGGASELLMDLRVATGDTIDYYAPVLLYATAASALPDEEMRQLIQSLSSWSETASVGQLSILKDQSIHMPRGYIEIGEMAAPAVGAANFLKLYAKDSAGVSRLFYKDDAGVEHGPL